MHLFVEASLSGDPRMNISLSAVNDLFDLLPLLVHGFIIINTDPRLTGTAHIQWASTSAGNFVCHINGSLYASIALTKCTAAMPVSRLGFISHSASPEELITEVRGLPETLS